jgi:uncharacterized protein
VKASANTASPASAGSFLTAEWRWLAMLNYVVPPELLQPAVPRGTELDLWQGQALVSMVGFRFLNTRVRGWAVPGHRDFDEVNLRFYVRRRAAEEWRRGVVFIREIVPRAAIAWVARWLYHEPYLALPMAHELAGAPGAVTSTRYAWQFGGRENFLSVRASGAPQPLCAGSDAEFITEHYWGYNRQPDGGTLEYQVEHPRWRVSAAADCELNCAGAALYGDRLGACLRQPPVSAFLAEGSAVTVRRGVRVAA